LRVLEEKAKEKVEAEKGKVVKKIEGAAKDAVLGKKGESDARVTFDAAQKGIDTYEDIQKKVQKTKDILEMLRAKKDGLSAEAKALEASYAACVANLPEEVKALATGGIKLAVPGNRPVRAIVFDWAGVMAAEAFWIWSRKNEVDVGPIMAVDMKVNTGEMPHEEFVALVAKVSGKTSDEVWAGVKAEMILDQELIALIRELKKKYKIGLLSNFTAPWLREVLDENKLWDLYDEHIISSEHKLVKPDSAIYKKMLSMLDVAPEETIFADDRQINIDAAKKVGMRAFLFTTTEAFKKDLKDAGVQM
ncbi:HAD family phosphatase, partial [Patescibacteria group bacterium]|nr:HAD family phosphatase [Patescibacteria group bacterium]